MRRFSEVHKHDRDNGLFESERRHEFGWLDEADGVARTKITKFLLRTWRQLETTIQMINMCWFSEDVLTLPDQQTMKLERLHHRITSCSFGRCDADRFSCLSRECTRYIWQNLLNVAVEHTHTISIAMSRGEWTSPTFSQSLFVSHGPGIVRGISGCRVMFCAAVLMTRCDGTLNPSTCGGERPVCNPELNQSNSVLTPCTFNLRTTRAHTAEQVDDANASDDFAKRHLQ